jgi:hypothetical protein
MTIAILYICTGKYSIFWNNFYKSCQAFLLEDAEKHYFVFTDDPTIIPSEFIHVVHQNARGFPLDSLLRFEMFLTIKEQLSSFDYIIFINANFQLVAPVGYEILPDQRHEGLAGVLHAGYINSSPFWMPFERNKRSSAYVPPHLKCYNYYLGGINGGLAREYLNMIEICHQNIQSDLDKGYMAFYHDESHINRYFTGKNILQLSPSYGYPEDWNLPFEPKILILNKTKHGGAYFDKLPSSSCMKRGRLFLKRLTEGLLWYLK